MKVLRLVANFATPDPAALADFYLRLLDLDVVMDHGWIVTLASPEDVRMRPQLGLASEGGSGTPVPELSVEVDDVAEVHRRAQVLGAEIAYPLSDEPWGVRRFFVRDPAGRLLNVLEHL
ncbi:catechol 2,3-dioxygenase-like lactoylglutathione lyase family enzyme [Pseudomonas alcaligenes]|nr:catechol 2,3-dioxygenase-like lactoylglutathione lyase family enzyme [Pseudomonas alcaligenes]